MVLHKLKVVSEGMEYPLRNLLGGIQTTWGLTFYHMKLFLNKTLAKITTIHLNVVFNNFLLL
jgi:hypothetical protein